MLKTFFYFLTLFLLKGTSALTIKQFSECSSPFTSAITCGDALDNAYGNSFTVEDENNSSNTWTVNAVSGSYSIGTESGDTESCETSQCYAKEESGTVNLYFGCFYTTADFYFCDATYAPTIQPSNSPSSSPSASPTQACSSHNNDQTSCQANPSCGYYSSHGQCSECSSQTTEAACDDYDCCEYVGVRARLMSVQHLPRYRRLKIQLRVQPRPLQ